MVGKLIEETDCQPGEFFQRKMPRWKLGGAL
jgi:hypothetical protein